ncbi:MAG: 2-oxoglutarate dehydrogenase complex dihydrolipoyllysine-residue succinyltransferase [Candidatus Binatia bacterium]|nr:2-oxoglutarate dehydrogenase complex dihydrolipoyllysine-residue succinyltransferase [Candidatus Binatia bacterium]
MATDIVIPALGESITEATIVRWLKGAGERVEQDEVIVEIETDKATMELVAPETGVLEIVKGEGAKVQIGETIGRVSPVGETRTIPAETTAPHAVSHVARPAPAQATEGIPPLSPAVRRLVEEHGLEPGEIAATGRGGRLTKGDVLQYLETQGRTEVKSSPQPTPSPVRVPPSTGRPSASPQPTPRPEVRERREPMSRIRKRIAERLVQAQHTAAILTTFNEIDMTAVLALRAKYNEVVKERFGVSLGLLSFFAKASVEALRAFPAINAEIRGDDIVYKDYYALGIAVATEQGLLVPVIREVDRKSMVEIEVELAELSQRARTGKISVEELTGGTFTISNGGVFGSLLSTPILNPPQSGILGLHKIEKRPVVGPNDEIVVRSMMYVALSYDHRIVDGREAVLFLRRIKECIEDPNRILLGL